MILLLFFHFPVEDIYGTIKYPASKLKVILCAGVRGYYFCVETLTNELGEVGLVTKSRLPRPLVTSTLLTWALRPPCHYLVLLLGVITSHVSPTATVATRAREICRSSEK